MSRFIAGLFVAVLAATSFADTGEPTPAPVEEAPKPPAAKPADAKFPLKVVKLLPESEQALLFDTRRNRHVLVEVGETVGDYTVSAIGADEVTLVGKDMPVEIALFAPEAKKAKKAPVAKAPKPADPYAAEEPVATAEPAPAEAPADPYADDEAAAPLVEGEDEPRVASADPEHAAERAVENTIRATQWGSSKPHAERSKEIDGTKSTTSPFANMSADAAKPSDEVANAGVEKQPETKADGPTSLSKKEVNAALTDFAKLAASIDGSFGANGLVLEKVQAGSVFAKAGLQVGDVVTSIDGKPLKSIDDAADLYARAGGMKSATVQIVRAGAPKTLRIAIQ